MVSCAFDRSTKRFVGGQRRGTIEHDPETQVVVDLPDYPDRVTQRWNGKKGVRKATAAELAAAEEEDRDRRAGRIDPFLRAVVEALNDGSLPVGQNLTPAQIKAAIKAKLE